MLDNAVKQLAIQTQIAKEQEKKMIEEEKKFNASSLATSLPDSVAFDET